MECKEVQKRLSAYIEKLVAPKQKALIDAHLKGCKKCKRALADLKKAVDYVQKLEEVEPPTWITQKVMARLRSEAEEKKGIIQKIFYPFHIKIPLEAIALMLVTVGTIYIFKSIQPQMQVAQAPLKIEETAPPTFAPKKKEVHDVAEDKRLPAEPAEQFRDTDKKTTSEREPVGLAKAPAKEVQPEKPAPAVGATESDELERRPSSSVVFEKGLRSEQRTEGVILTVNVIDLAIANKDIEGTIRQLGGRIIKQESIGDKAIINAEIDSKQMTELVNQLNLIGEVQEQSAALEPGKGDEVHEEGMALKGGEGEVGVQIELERQAQ